MEERFLKIKTELLKFTKIEVDKFLQENINKTFYAFAYDCNAEYAEINLCFNTEEDFEKTLNNYQKGEFGKNYQSEEEIYDLKYNTGDWDYQCFSTTYLFSDDELEDILDSFPEDDYLSWHGFTENLLNLFCEVLVDFSKTEIFSKIPKTNDFKFLCLDHDEDIKNAEERLIRIKNR